jgi:asparagine synthase (glutamine-hydrolysing)
MRLMPSEQVSALLTSDAARLVGHNGAGPMAAALDAARDLDLLSRLQYADGCVYLPDDILVKVDRASMLNSLEVRCPLLDHRFLELMASVPPALRLVHGRGKHLFKRALRGVVPDVVLDRPKMGFGVPLEAWFGDDLAPFVREILLDRRTAERGIFSPPGLEQLIRRRADRAELAAHVWAALVFEMWCRSYLDER